MSYIIAFFNTKGKSNILKIIKLQVNVINQDMGMKASDPLFLEGLNNQSSIAFEYHTIPMLLKN